MTRVLEPHQSHRNTVEKSQAGNAGLGFVFMRPYVYECERLQMIDPGNPAIKPTRPPRTSILHFILNPIRLR